jgi:hypothetical protein
MDSRPVIATDSSGSATAVNVDRRGATAVTLLIHGNTNDVTKCDACRLGGVVASVIATRNKGRGFKPGRSDLFLREVNILSTSYFGLEVKPETPYLKILRHLKDPLTYLRY